MNRSLWTALSLVAASCLAAAPGSAAPKKAAAPKYDPHYLAGVWVQQDRAPAYGKIIPYNKEYAAILQQHIDDIAAGHPFRHDKNVCLPRGIIGLMTTGSRIYPIEIFQTGQKELAINMETTGSFYRIHLNRGHKPKDEQYPHYFGDTIGHWEGDVLVADSITLGKMDSLDAQAPVSDSLHVVQRFHRTAYDTLEDQITLEDPKAWAGPVTVTMHYKLDPDGELDEVVCDNEREIVSPTGKTSIVPNQ
jgi:hypothetical protein